jgi:ABC-type branched-subunit amino acid transport system substrate-binding protein
MQNRVDVGVGIARRWYEQEQADRIIGIPHSAIALGVVRLAEQTNRLVLPTAAATAELTGKSCSAKQGGDAWLFITVDYALGHALEQNATEFLKAAGGRVPLHYLKAVKAAGTDEAKAVMAKMKEMPINDFMTRNGRIREDGRVIRDMYLMQVKRRDESKGEWDLAKTVATIPGEQAFRPLAEGGGPLVKK